jgi:hypothetical protein
MSKATAVVSAQVSKFFFHMAIPGIVAPCTYHVAERLVQAYRKLWGGWGDLICLVEEGRIKKIINPARRRPVVVNIPSKIYGIVYIICDQCVF